ncbi:hypothetical protein EYF80_028736 [Liparis tanakae]|uniref:Uncharacterized protein n=1 Tax=Liparis tanakae TaxID=230148 RepID=A0A4Z2H7T9_9TELE|nr:hypothetical protein EYF80_028736 [Liparis tanakae]
MGVKPVSSPAHIIIRRSICAALAIQPAALICSEPPDSTVLIRENGSGSRESSSSHRRRMQRGHSGKILLYVTLSLLDRQKLEFFHGTAIAISFPRSQQSGL